MPFLPGHLALLFPLLLGAIPVNTLDNGLTLPPMGWSSWYGFTTHISEEMIEAQASGLVSSGLAFKGYDNVWLDDGWIVGREDGTGRPIEDPNLLPSGIAALSSYVHSLGLKFGIYTSKGNLTCLGEKKNQPDRPGSCGFEEIDARTYALEWRVDQVKDDGCGVCAAHDPWKAMGTALNETGRPILFAIHAGYDANPEYARVANMWRVGDDLSQSSYGQWTNRLDLATSDDQAALAGPGALPNPDFLEVGYSPRMCKGSSNVMSPLEQRSMYTMWAALPGPLILSADLRPRAECGGIDEEALETLTNEEVIAVNQDEAVMPMRPIRRDGIVEVWRKPLADPQKVAVVLFHRGNSTESPMPQLPPSKTIWVDWNELGYRPNDELAVRDLWKRRMLGMFVGRFEAVLKEREALIFTFTKQRKGAFVRSGEGNELVTVKL